MRKLSIALSVTAAMLLAGGLTGTAEANDLEEHARGSRCDEKFFAFGSGNGVQRMGPVLSARFPLALQPVALLVSPLLVG